MQEELGFKNIRKESKQSCDILGKALKEIEEDNSKLVEEFNLLSQIEEGLSESESNPDNEIRRREEYSLFDETGDNKNKI